MKKEYIIMVIFCVLIAISSFFGGVAIGAISMTKVTFEGLDNIDNIEINVDINESKMVAAMLPYIEAEEVGRR